MVRLAQKFNMRMPLVDGQGNFGSMDGDSAAAMRYTEARLTPLALEMLRDLDMDTVRWCWNYDDKLQEPEMLPSRFPNILVNGSSGIAVGLATNIPPHNLGEVIDGVVAYIEKKEHFLEGNDENRQRSRFPHRRLRGCRRAGTGLRDGQGKNHHARQGAYRGIAQRQKKIL